MQKTKVTGLATSTNMLPGHNYELV
jgi:hypothetical protein